MKKLLITVAAVLMATSAYATDLPKKNKAPAAPAPVAAATTTSESVDSLAVAYGQDTAVGNLGTKTDDIYQLTYTHKLGNGIAVGGMAQTTQDTGNTVKQNLEAQASYTLPAFAGVSVTGKVGLGEKFQSTNFGYYALYGQADVKLMDKLTWNAASYRYRSAFDTANYGYQSNQLGTGVTYDLASNYAVSAKVYRNYDTNFNSTGDQFMLGLNVKF
jgi:hypothetical protein